MNLKYVLLAVSMTLIQGAYAQNTKPQTSDYDQLCRLAGRAMDSALDKGLDPTVYMRENLDSEVQSQDVKDAYLMIFAINPDKRYTVFVEAASMVLKKPWECAPLNSLFEHIRKHDKS